MRKDNLIRRLGRQVLLSFLFVNLFDHSTPTMFGHLCKRCVVYQAVVYVSLILKASVTFKC